MSTTVTGSKRHLNINADEFAGDLNGTVNTATTATTQSTSDNSTKVATTAFVKAQGYITTQSDTQDLTQSGNTVSLVDGGSVDISTTTAVAANSSKTSFPGFDSTVLNSSVTLSSLGAQAAGSYLTSLSGAVLTTGTQTIAGLKTFSNNVELANTADLKFVDVAGSFPTSGKGFDWTLNNDGARIYAIQPSSDSIDLVFQLRDNATTNDRFVFHVDDYQGAAFDKYPLIIRGGTQFDLVDSSLYTNGTVRLSNAGALSNVTNTNWDAAYTHSQTAHAPSNAQANVAETYTQHENITAATSVNGTGRAYIQDITVDSNGHVTGIATASETVVNTNTQNNAATTYAFFSGSGINTSNGVITNTTYAVGNGGLTQNNFTDALKTSYDGAATHAATAHAPAGATVNSSNATLLARSNHTGTQSYDTISNPPTIPSGNAIIDWTTDRGTTNIHSGNYTNTTYNKASSTYLGLVKVGGGLAISSAGVLSVSQAEEADEETGGAMSAEDKTKLNAIEETADVTDATNVAAAGASMKSATETISGAKTFSSTIVGSINGNSATTSERTITSGEISAISTNTSKVGITTGTQTIAGAKTFSTQIIGQTINLGSSSGYINRTAAQFATDGTDKVYIGSNNYGWNDARDYATNLVDVDAPVLDQNDQHCGIICPVNVSQVSIMSQVRMNAANGTMQVKVYKMARATAVNTSNLTLTLIASATVSTVNGRMTTLDATGSTAVSAGDLIIVGFGKTDGGAGQKPRFNFTLTGTTS